MMTLTLDHNLSKRTAVYAQYSKIDNGTGTTYYYVAGPTTNNGLGVGGSMTAGVDVTIYGAGVKTSF
jgi:predicted porin